MQCGIPRSSVESSSHCFYLPIVLWPRPLQSRPAKGRINKHLSVGFKTKPMSPLSSSSSSSVIDDSLQISATGAAHLSRRRFCLRRYLYVPSVCGDRAIFSHINLVTIVYGHSSLGCASLKKIYMSKLQNRQQSMPLVGHGGCNRRKIKIIVPDQRRRRRERKTIK